MSLNYWRNTSIRVRLFALGLLSGGLMVALFATTRWSDWRVEQADRTIETAQQEIQSANDSMESSGLLKDNVNRLQQEVMEMRLLEKRFLQTHQADLSSRFQELAGRLATGLEGLQQTGISAEFKAYAGAFAERAQLAKEHDDLNGKMTRPLKESEGRLADILNALEGRQSEVQMDGTKLSDTELEMMNVVRDCRIVFLRLQTLQQQFIATGDQKYVTQYKQVAGEDAKVELQSLRKFSAALNNTNFVAASQAVTESLDDFLKDIDHSLTLGGRERDLEARLETSGESILKAASQQLEAANQTMAGMKTGVAAAKQQMQQARTVAGATKKSATVAIIVIVLAGMILGAVMNLAIIVSVNRALNNMIDRLRGSVEQTLESATQVSTASKSLADGASTQAASIEESSSSLEELASMTQINAENAQKTNELAREARSAADRGADDVQSLNTAMSALQNSSNDISKIIRTIDEIAFQTNILALNAAVEAARAGEAGMGFAVVADEVRTLAQRSATAAKETAVKIEGTMGNTGQGVQISAKVVATLQEIVAKVHRVDELAAEAAGASREQSQGIQQINQAVGQMDRVTQSNAANAEQSSAAAEELKAQAEVMRQAVNELSLLVGGERQSGGFRDEHPAFPLRPVSALRSDSWARPAGRAELKPRGGAPAASKATVMMAPQSPLPDAGKSLPG